MFRKSLLPEIECGKRYENSGDDAFSPLFQLLTDKSYAGKSFFLTAQGGVGKTTTLRALWLDYLADKIKLPCIYVALKLLDGNNEDRAIRKFIISNYGFDITNFSSADNKPILLLDGANEADEVLKLDDGSGKCRLVRECTELLNIGFRLVITGRAGTITSKGQAESCSESYEFENNKIVYGRLCELTDEQLKSVNNKAVRGTALYRLLKNNMMLSIYTHLSSYGIEQHENITAGRLLDAYFKICFRTRYVASVLGDGKLNELFGGQKDGHLTDEGKLYRKICEVESLSDRNYLHKQIRNALKQFTSIFDYLAENAEKTSFDIADFPEDTDLSVINILSLSVRNGKGNYIWANEVYQEYFKAQKYIKALTGISGELKGKRDNDKIAYFRNLLDELYRKNRLDYFSVQYAGELMSLTSEDIDLLYDWGESVTDREIDNYNLPLYKILSRTNYSLLITRLSVLTGGGFPRGMTEIDVQTFNNCRQLQSIVIPERIVEIGNSAFNDCTGLKSATIYSQRILTGAFNGCTSLEEVNFDNHVSYISKRVFSMCPSLKVINYSGTRHEWLRQTYREYEWADDSGDFVVRCQDGVVEKEEMRLADDRTRRVKVWKLFENKRHE